MQVYANSVRHDFVKSYKLYNASINDEKIQKEVLFEASMENFEHFNTIFHLFFKEYNSIVKDHCDASAFKANVRKQYKKELIL